MYVKKGTTLPTPSDYDFVSEEILLNGLAVLIENTHTKKALNEQDLIYTIAITVPANAEILLQSEGFGKIRQAYLNK